MRAVNLIPSEQRRAARGDGRGPNIPRNVLLLLGGLGFAFVAVLSLVLVSNQINSKQDALARTAQKQQSAQAAADALKPYGDFVKVQQDRLATVTALENTRFNWERVVRQLSHVTAPGAWVSTFKGTVSSVSGTGGGSSSGLRGSVQGPAVEIKGCAPDQETVARMMARMRNIDGATEVVTSRSEKTTADAGAGAASGAAGASTSEGCPNRYYEFELVVGLTGGSSTAVPGGAVAAAPAGATGSTGATGGTGDTGTTEASGGTP